MKIGKKIKIIGIDYGSKLAGTTAISFIDENSINIVQSLKNKDADKFISEFLIKHNPDFVFIDAPLSLPKAYFNNSSEDYFFRECDRILKAMSPMFLGGLTARAMKLKNSFPDVKFVETYPKKLAEMYFGSNYKKKNLSDLINKIEKKSNYTLSSIPDNFHKLDSLLALMSGIRFIKNEAERIGDPEEGIIVF